MNSLPAAIPGRVSTQVRLDERYYAKLKIIAEIESRSINAQLEHFMKQGVTNYEAEHGPIQIPNDSD